MTPRFPRRPLCTFPEKVWHTLTTYRMVDQGDRIVVGVSGGPDSMALLHTLARLQGAWGGSLVVAHFNHGLRPGEAEAEANFVRHTAYTLSLPYIEQKGEVKGYAQRYKCSLQEAARALRYQFFHAVLCQQQAQKIAVAHTANDQAETLLIALVRGTARSGLRGIIPQRDDQIIRPLLATTREEVETFLADANIPYVLDPTNTKVSYPRNRIRHHLLPLLQRQYNPQIIPRLYTLAKILHEEEMYLASKAEEAYQQAVRSTTPGQVIFDLAVLQSFPPAIMRRVVRLGIGQIEGGEVNSFHLERVVLLVTTGKTEQTLHLPGKIIVQRQRQKLDVKRKEQPALAPMPQPLRVPGETVLPWCQLILHTTVYRRRQGETITFAPEQELLDYQKTGDQLWIRTWQKGDRFTPLGMHKSKRLGRFFIDEKIPRALRARIPLLTTAPQGGEVLYVVGKRIADQMKITADTREILQITWTFWEKDPEKPIRM